MKNLIKLFVFAAIITFASSCKEDEGNLPNISFKTGGSYLSADSSFNPKTQITIGINASKAEDKDVLKKFNISKSVNGAAGVTVFDKDLTGTEGDSYTYDYTTAIDSVSGNLDKYTFTVTNRDGLVNQVFLTVRVK